MPVQEWDRFWNDTPGLPTCECDEGRAQQVTVRSGEFIIGNIGSYIEYCHQTTDLSKQNASKLYYIPLHPAGRLPFHMVPLTITAQRIDPSSAPVLTYTFRDSTWSDAGYPFYPTGTVLPQAGLWKITAEAGDNWGCIVLRL
jgi:hypothetical protein